MTDNSRQRQSFDPDIAGDCEADPVPALWDSGDDYITEAGFIERFWLPVAIGVLAGWAGLSFLMYSAFGWWVLLSVFGVAFAGSVAAVALVRTGSRAEQRLANYGVATPEPERIEARYRNAA